MDRAIVDEIIRFVPGLTHLPPYVELHYDEEADVVYASFEHGAAADDSEMTDDDVLLRYKDGRLIGVTILRARERAGLLLPG